MAVNKPKYSVGFGLIGLLMSIVLSACDEGSSSASATTTMGTVSALATASPVTTTATTSPQPTDPVIVVRSSELGPEANAPVSPLVADDDIEDPRIKANRRAALTMAPGAQQSQIRRARLDVGMP